MQRALELENACADTVAGKGYRLHQNPTRQEIAEARRNTGDAGKPDKDPDYLIEGHVFDCYSPTPAKAVRGVWTEVSGKVASQQTQRIMLNLQDWRGDLGTLQKQFDDWPIHHLKELTALTPSGEIIQIVRRD
ncbi:CdiA C-terminal domain-containing protein [Micromonospora lupini]|uniref:CdiA C-terminal domain-containing protein n=1 Tax=Micromonospora lupini TaxID=285679 RepID=UPI0031E353C5